MAKRELLKLMGGFRNFREKFYLNESSNFSKLTTGWQGPKTLVIGCCDSRVDPAIISGAAPGELFVLRNVANLVPPYQADGGLHGVSAAIEFAVENLRVENVIILGHRQCGGIRALLYPEGAEASSFVQQWMQIAEPAKKRALQTMSGQPEAAVWRCCELESIRTSIENLHSFPFIERAIKERDLSVLGVYFDLEKGELLELNEQEGNFQPVPHL